MDEINLFRNRILSRMQTFVDVLVKKSLKTPAYLYSDVIYFRFLLKERG